MKPLILFVLALSLFALLPAPARAQWAADGNPVCTATAVQQKVSMAADGQGGAVMVWEDYRNGSPGDIYARRIDKLGATSWGAATNGLPLCTATGMQRSPRVAADGYGSLYYVWQDQRGGDWDLYTAITDLNGNVFTDPDGTPIAYGAGDQSSFSLASNTDAGLVYVTWGDTRDGPSDVYLQVFNSGFTFTPSDGAPICTAVNIQSGPVVCDREPSTNGAIVAWADFRSNNWDIYAQASDVFGTTQWANNGVPVCVGAGSQTAPMIVHDGSGGAIIAWEDSRNGAGNSIYAQHINASGNRLWGTSGIPIVISSGVAVPRMVSDGGGGAIITWQDGRNVATQGTDIYAQRIDVNGTLRWNGNGVAVCTAAYDQTSPAIAPDYWGGGAYLAWQDLRTVLSHTDIYVQYISDLYNGNPAWTANGVLLSGGTQNQFEPAIVNDGLGNGTCLLAWQDERNGGIGDIYAHRIDQSGKLGNPTPIILSIGDRPNDEGGYVRITWKAGDNAGANPTYQYVYVDDYPDPALAGPVSGGPIYTTDVPTSSDDVSDTYVLDAGTASGVFGVFAGSAASHDNLAPPAPTLSGGRSGPDVILNWNSTATDIQSYAIVRTDVGTVATKSTPGYTDAGAPWNSLTYRVRATDIHGNVGAWSNDLNVATALAVEGGAPPPHVLVALPNAPNPFAGSTGIRLGLPAAAAVRLEVYDVAGARTASRELGTLDAGWRTVAFDGRDDAGRRLPSGVYQYQLVVGGRRVAGRMVVTR
jgi:hypothetical protein